MALSQHIQYCTMHVACTPESMALLWIWRWEHGTLAHVFDFLSGAMIEGYSTSTALPLSAGKTWSRCFPKMLSQRLNVPTLESAWSHVTERHLGPLDCTESQLSYVEDVDALLLVIFLFLEACVNYFLNVRWTNKRFLFISCLNRARNIFTANTFYFCLVFISV